ncbi:MAG: FxLYD domain-containing protein, partial [Candidatus Thorarchaeota archaeon]
MILRKTNLVLFLLIIIALLFSLTSNITPAIIRAEPSEVEIVSHSYYVEMGYSTVVGEVKNVGSQNLEFVMITVTFYDKENNILSTGFTFTEIDTLVPQQKSPFEVSSFPDENLQVDHYKVVVSDYMKTSSNPYRRLKIQGVTDGTQYGYYTVRGEVKNIGEITATFVKVVATYYDVEGTVIGTSFTFTNPEDIEEGEAAPFETSTFPQTFTPASYSLQVECSESLSSSSVTCITSETSLVFGTNITVSGVLNPTISNVLINLTYTRPDNSILKRTVITNPDGTFLDSYQPDMLGTWAVIASWEGGGIYAGSSSDLTSFTIYEKIPTTISCSVSSSSASSGSSIIVSGAISPSVSDKTVTLTYSKQDGPTFMNTVKTDVNGAYSASYTPTDVGSWNVKASWEGDEEHEGAVSSVVSFTITKVPTSISIQASKPKVAEGESITVSGSINPTISEAEVTITFTKPDGSTFIRTVSTGSDGSYSDSYRPTEPGSWSIKASWEGDSEHGGATSQTISFILVQPPSTGSLKIIVQDEQGNLLSGAAVSSTSQPGDQQTISGSSGTDGSVTFIDIKIGDYTIQASKSGFETNSKSVIVLGGETTTLTIQLKEQVGTLKILVKDEEGKPISGATVTSTFQPSGQSSLSGTSGIDGLVTFSDVKP